MEFEPYSQHHFGMSGYAGPGMLNMSNLVTALPDYQARQYQQQPFPQHFQSPGAANQSLIYQYQQNAQFAGQTATSYNHPFAQQFPNQYVQGHQPRQQPQQPQQHAMYPQYIGNPGGANGGQHLQNQNYMLQQPMMHNTSIPLQQHQQHQMQPSQFSRQQHSMYGGAYDSRTVGGYPVPQLRLDSTLTHAGSANLHPHSPSTGMV